LQARLNPLDERLNRALELLSRHLAKSCRAFAPCVRAARHAAQPAASRVPRTSRWVPVPIARWPHLALGWPLGT